MKFFSSTNKQVIALLLCLLSSSTIKAACPLVCPALTGPAEFCNLLVDSTISTTNICATGNVQVGGTLAVCGATTSFVSLTGGAGSTGPISFGSLAALGFAWDPTVDQAVVAGNNTLTLTNSSILVNTAFAANALTPLVSGIYLINYVVNVADVTATLATFSIFVNGATVPGSQFTVGAGEIGAATGQALVSVVAGQPVIINVNAAAAGTIVGTASLTLEKVG